MSPNGFSQMNRVKGGRLLRNFQEAGVNQLYIYSENDVLPRHRIVTSYVRSWFDEVGKFCCMSRLKEVSCFLAYISASSVEVYLYLRKLFTFPTCDFI